MLRLYEAVPDPKIVIGVGTCATGGGMWFDSYNVMGGVDAVLPVNFVIPGCPPRPEAILHGLAVALEMLEKQTEPQYMVQSPDRPEPAPGDFADIPEALPHED